MTFREILTWTDEQLDALTDDEVRTLAYEIKYFDPDQPSVTPRILRVRAKLNNRLYDLQDKDEAARKARLAARPPVEMVRCACGHTIPKHLVMSASRGTSCPDCYDRMSDDEPF